MGLIDRLGAAVRRWRRSTYQYRCADCDVVFESPASHPTEAECVECGSGDVHSAR